MSEEYMNIYSPPGTLVQYAHEDAGYKHHQEAAKAKLELGCVYEVEKTDVYSSSSTVKLRGIPGTFNTVLFAPAPSRAEASCSTFDTDMDDDDYEDDEPGLNDREPAGLNLNFDLETVRDHFAGLALSALVAKTPYKPGVYEDLARGAYLYADAMLEAR